VTLLQEHDLDAMKTQVELQKLVIEDLQHKLSDSVVLVEKLQVGGSFWPSCCV